MKPAANASLFAWADHYRSLGLSVVPLREGKVPGVKWKEFQTRLASRSELADWFYGTDRFWGIALVCGAVSGNLARIDFDDPDDYASVKQAIRQAGKFGRFPVFKSQREGGGYGVLFLSTDPIPTLPQNSFPKLAKTEVRGEGSITVLPPTPGYKWLSTMPDLIPTVSGRSLLKDLFNFDLADKQRFAESVGSTAKGELATLLTETTEGERNGNIVKLASMLRARGIDQDTARAVVERAFEEHWPQDGMDEDEVRDTFDKAWQRYEHEGVRITGDRPAAISIGKLDELDDAPRIEVRGFGEINPHEPFKDELIPGFVMRGEEGNTIFAADTKTGKTSVVADACITASRGDQVWGTIKIAKPVRAVIIDQERKFRTMRDNQLKMGDVIGAPDDSMLKVITLADGNFAIDQPAALDMLYRELYEYEPDLVVLDGWGWFVCHMASDPKYVKPALAWLKKMRSTLGCATVIIHHFRKGQFKGNSADHQDFMDQLDKIEGAKRLCDQAHTVLGYTPITKYEEFSILDGRTNNSSWNPLKQVFDYDELSVTHRIVAEDEGAELFDTETFRMIWTRSQESRAVRRQLSYVMNRLKINRTAVAELLGADRAMVSKWYSGQRSPSSDNAAKILALYEKTRAMPLKSGSMPKMASR